MRISIAVVSLAAAVLAVQPVHAQAKGKKGAASATTSGPMVAPPATLVGRWEGTFTNDVTQKGGRLVLVLNGSDDSATGQLSLTPMGAKSAIGPENAPMAAPAKGKAPMAGGLEVTAMKSGDDKVTGNIESSYLDPSCNCSVVSGFEGTLSGNTIVGTISARDARTGQWNFSSFTATKGGGKR